MVWLVFVVLLVLAGALVWAVRSGRAPESVRRCLSWWLDLDDGSDWSAPVRETEPDLEAVPPPEAADAWAPRQNQPRSAVEPVVVRRGLRASPPAAQEPPPRVAEPVLPEIKLEDVALNLKDRRYRAHPALQHEADPVLPLLDGQAIRDNLKRRLPTALAGTEDDVPLPVIGADEVESNLQQLAGRDRIRPPEPERPLPLIDADEVRASLQQIHGNRMKTRAGRSPVASPAARPLETSPSISPSSSAPARSPLLSSSAPDRAQAVFVPAPVSREPVAVRAQNTAPAPLMPASVQPVPIPTVVAQPEPPRRPQPAPELSLPRLEPLDILPVPVIVAAPSVSLPPEPVADAPLQVSSEPSILSVAPVAPTLLAPTPIALTPVVPTHAAPGLVWHSIEEREQAGAVAASDTDEVAEDFAITDADDAVDASDDCSVPAATLAPWAQSAPPAPRPAPRPAYDPSCLPGIDLLTPADVDQEACPEEVLLERGIVIEEKLAEFKVKVSVVDAYAGPVITRFEVEPAVGVRGSQVVNLIKDLARALGLASIRVVETIPGKTCMGLELPNPVRHMIRLSEIFSSEAFQDPSPKLTLALGKDITGEPVVMDLARAPHLLVAGTTGSGKSVGVNAMILSLLYRFTPDDVRFIMIDPKMLELSVYNDIPHLLAPVVTDMKLAANALNWCVGEMEKRYRLMSALGVRNLAGYNEKVRAAQLSGSSLKNPFSLTPEDPEPLEQLPAIVVVVDEFADLMMVAGKKIEELIARLAQKARAAGLHLILATQRPSVDVITGLIKANIPTRIAFQVSSKVDSRTILDQMGAEALLGQGDMLYLPPGSGYPQRIHGAFVADDEVHKVVQVLKQFGEPDYVEGLLTGESELEEEASAGGATASSGTESDPLYDDAVEIVLRTRRASISSVQRHLRIGYNRAARLIEEMEAAGLVSAMENNGSRSVLVPQREV